MANDRFSGRDLRIKVGTNTLACLNTKTVNINNEPVDVTGDCDDAFVTLLERAGTTQLTFDASGFTQDDDLRHKAISGSVYFADCDIEYLSADGDGTVIYTITADLFMSAFSETGASDGGLEFTASFASSGEFAGVRAL